MSAITPRKQRYWHTAKRNRPAHLKKKVLKTNRKSIYLVNNHGISKEKSVLIPAVDDWSCCSARCVNKYNLYYLHIIYINIHSVAYAHFSLLSIISLQVANGCQSGTHVHTWTQSLPQDALDISLSRCGTDLLSEVRGCLSIFHHTERSSERLKLWSHSSLLWQLSPHHFLKCQVEHHSQSVLLSSKQVLRVFIVDGDISVSTSHHDEWSQTKDN